MITAVICVQFELHRPLIREEEGKSVKNGDGETLLTSKSGVVATTMTATSSMPEHYTVFSTSCSPFQDWQSYVFFFFAYRIRQPGKVVRIVSGCSGIRRAELDAFHEEKVKVMSDDFSVHFTPDFARSSGDNYMYYNKPFGVQHWMKYGLEFEKNRARHDDAIIMVLDPDMILLRQLTYDFTNTNLILHHSKRGPPPEMKVSHGNPWASLYAFGKQPFNLDLAIVFANATDSPALKTPIEEQRNNYPGGPPYMATGRDMWSIVETWCDLVPKVHAVYVHLMGEMYAWSLAAAHLELPHTLAESFMVSNTEISEEGWALVDAVKKEDACVYPVDKPDTMPYVLHYCQRYSIGKWFVGKYRLDKHFLSCDKPLFMEPPDDVGTKYDFYIQPGGNPYGTKEKLRPERAHREAFMACQMIKRLNEVATWYKDHHCEKETVNYNKTFIFHHSLDPADNTGGEKTA